MTTAALLAVYAAAILAASGAQLAAGFVAVGAARPPTVRERRLVVGLVAGAATAVLVSTVLAVLLAGRGWWFAGEKLVVASPFAAVGLGCAVVGLVRWRREPAEPGPRVLMLGGGFAVAAGAAACWILGYPPMPAATAVLAGLVVLGTGLAWAVLARRGRRAIVGFAGIGVIVLAGSIGWVWLADTAPPSIEASAAHAHAGGAPGANAGALPASGAGAEASAAVSVDELRTPEGLDAPVRRIELVAAHRELTLSSGTEIEAWSFGDRLPGPEIRVTEGELVEATLRNRDIDDGVTLHWHGVDVPNGEDGVAGVTQDAVMPGGEFVSRFVADTPGSYWYHTHQVSSEGVRRGLYGMLVVEPAGGVAEALDLAVPVHTIGGAVLLGGDDGEQLHEAEPGTAVRLRVANTDRTPLRAAVAGAPFRVVAVDGRDLDGGRELTGEAVALGAGARADLVFEMPDGEVRFVVDATDGSALVFRPPGDGATGDSADAGPEASEPAPAELPELDLLDYGTPPETPPGEVPAEFGEVTATAELVLDRMPRFVGGAPNYAYTVNGRVFPHIEPVEVDEGDVVRLTIANRGFEVHPMHVHGHHVLVLSRDGEPARGAPLWLDTVDVRPGEVWEVLLVADNPGIWMDHCHDLEHAAAGMMMSLAYRGVETPFEHDAHGNRPE
ncbi:multicopper oxidase family protein [Agromyces italicus]|uniref:multicopper oxidase family protein n=1 Tax=Agromyces italicus TaxID=279572 RepID=UPI0003B71E1B|nr:multicopper oxidase family protein [Agromyces italicus]